MKRKAGRLLDDEVEEFSDNESNRQASSKRQSGGRTERRSLEDEKPVSSLQNQRQSVAESDNVYRVAGIIDTVEVENFLCHSHLKINFNRNVSFIIGVNGSGKSAILTAVLLALGERASTTSRGNSAKDLIKTGETQAVVRITLVNKGMGAYKPEDYGSHIIIERTININGTGGYKIRSLAGRVISTKREEINRLTFHMNIQVNNPVCVLNQETAKNFLNSNDPKQRYKLFERATQLDVMHAKLKAAEDELALTKACLKVKKEELDELKLQVEQWQQKKEAFQNIDELQKAVKELEDEAAWAQCNALEKEAQGYLQKLDQFTAFIEKGKESKRQKESELEQIGQQVEEMSKKAAEKETIAKSKEEEQRTLDRKLQQLVQQQRALQQEIRQLERDRQVKLTEKTEIESTINFATFRTNC